MAKPQAAAGGAKSQQPEDVKLLVGKRNRRRPLADVSPILSGGGCPSCACSFFSCRCCTIDCSGCNCCFPLCGAINGPWDWRRAYLYSKLYSVIIFFGVLVMIVLWHSVAFDGGWHNCRPNAGPNMGETSIFCVISIHLFAVPVIFYLTWVGLYAFMFLETWTAHRYAVLVGGNAVLLAGTAVFEIIETTHAIQDAQASNLEIATTFVGLIITLAGFMVSIFVLVMMNKVWYPLVDPAFLHPSTEEELVRLVQEANLSGSTLRVRGSLHSFPHTKIFAGDPSLSQYENGNVNVNIQLDKYIKVLNSAEIPATGDAEKKLRVEVEAGCNLGRDPELRTSTWENSLDQFVYNKGYALPDLGGITHQTVSGFMMTGSSGGTCKYDLYNCVVAIRFIDGTGQIHTFKRDDPDYAAAPQDNPFFALVPSMGLLGVISRVTFEFGANYWIRGTEVTSSLQASEVQLIPGLASTDPDAVPIEKFLYDTEYTRILWWPQLGVSRNLHGAVKPKPVADTPGKAVVWKSHRVPVPSTGTPREPYVELTALEQVAANKFYDIVNTERPPYKFLKTEVVTDVINLFTPDTPAGEPKTWHDMWYRSLNMDDNISDDQLPTEFTELWIPLNLASRVNELLQEELFNVDVGMGQMGTYSWELYAVGATDEWWLAANNRNLVDWYYSEDPTFKEYLADRKRAVVSEAAEAAEESPDASGAGGDEDDAKVDQPDEIYNAYYKLDVFWFRTGLGDGPTEFYKQIWDLLDRNNIPYRPHWGKYMPDNVAQWLPRMYGDNWGKFMALREQLDPNNIFVNEYWSQHLGIPMRE